MSPPPEKFSGERSGRNQKCFSSPDLSDHHNHSPPRTIITIHCHATTTTQQPPPPKGACGFKPPRQGVRLAVTRHHKGAFDSPQHHARVFVSVVPRQQKRGAGWFSKMAPQGCVGFGLSPRAAFGFKMAAKGVVGLAVILAEGCRVWDNGFRACLAVETAGEGVGLAVGQPGHRVVWSGLVCNENGCV
ncbi:hypothetical protein Tco_0651523 [Tanacetum coccineum]|uniref:Uncharacterized protein n=1 Tax=Tanacetum coccineum TaxID=301880 RepID=A0ABQ4WV00_9ASTR